jgi:hypothetical protein
MSTRPTVIPFRPPFRRRDEVARQVAAWDAGAAAGEDWPMRARRELEDLGPVPGAFAAYLGSRIDLFSATDCRALAGARRKGRASAPDVVRSLLSAEPIARGSQHLAVDPVPASVSTVTQAHHAFLPDGRMVDVHVHTASFFESADDLESLALVEPVFGGRLGRAALVSAIADFRVRFHQDADLLAIAALLEDGARDVARGAPMLLPRPLPDLCSSRMLVTDMPDGERSPFASVDPWSAQADKPSAVKAWLQQALSGSVCPIFAPDERIVMCGDRFMAASLVRIPRGTQQALLAYLFAVAGELPDRAWNSLQPELAASAQAQPADQVRREFRRLVPFRDDRFTETRSAAADRAFLQWRIASGHGWLPAPHVVPFYRGLFGALCAAEDANGEEDVVAEALASLRVPSDARDLGAWMADADVMSAVERQMALLIDLPQKIDRLLTVAADGAVRVQLVAADPSGASRRNRVATTVSLLLVAAALIVLAGAMPALRQLWASEPWRSAGFVVTGAVLVWAVGRLR